MSADAESVRALYESTLQPRLRDIDGLRRRLRGLIVKSILVLSGPFLVMVNGDTFQAFVSPAMAFVISAGAFLVLMAAFLFVIVRYLVPGFTAYVNYAARFKKEIVAELLRLVCPSAEYLPYQALPREVFEASGLFRAHGRYRSGDLVRGRIGVTPFEAAEVRLGYGSKNRYVAFHGLFFHIDFNKRLSGTTLVQPVGALAASLGPRDGLTRVSIDDPPFASHFDVYSTDAVEARDVLTPAMRERILEARRRTGRPIFLSFRQARVHVGIHYGRALFEPNIAATTSLEALQEMAAHFQLAEVIVDELDLKAPIVTTDIDDALPSRAPAAQADPLAVVAAKAGALDEHEVWTLATGSRAFEDEDTGLVVPPSFTRVRIDHDGDATTVSYGWPISFYVWLAVIVLSVSVEVSALRGVAEVVGLGPLGPWLKRTPFVEPIDDLVRPFPWPWLAAAALAGALAALLTLFRVRRVVITTDAVRVSRGFRPWPRRYARPPYDRISRRDRAVHLAKPDEFQVTPPTLSPVLPSEEEATWVAAEMRRGMRATRASSDASRRFSAWPTPGTPADRAAR
ncbi:MAG: DUF3137 domain-containing protein [Vicinamibacterales bacterium]